MGPACFHAAGRFQLDNAVLGVPTVGCDVIENQKILFPELTTESWDLDSQINLLQRLIDDSKFWNETTDYAWEAVQQFNYANRRKAMMEVLRGDMS